MRAVRADAPEGGMGRLAAGVPGRMGPLKLAPAEGPRPFEAGARKGRGPASWRPIKGLAVSSTALAGCGRGRDGRGCGEREGPRTVRHEGATDPSPEGHGSVTGVRPRHGDVGNPTLPPVLSNGHAPDPSIPVGKGPPGAGKCDVPGISVTDWAEAWKLSGGIVTEVRPRAVPVTPPSRKSDLAPSL